MKALDVISIFDKIRPNSIDYKTKRQWLNCVEAEIRRFAVLYTEKSVDMSFMIEENPELYLDEVYIDLYTYYLISMADITNGEYRMYNISSTYFNGIMDKWKKIHRGANKPCCSISISI